VTNGAAWRGLSPWICPGDQLLSRCGLSGDQNRQFARSDLSDKADHLSDRSRPSEDRRGSKGYGTRGLASFRRSLHLLYVFLEVSQIAVQISGTRLAEFLLEAPDKVFRSALERLDEFEARSRIARRVRRQERARPRLQALRPEPPPELSHRRFQIPKGATDQVALRLDEERRPLVGIRLAAVEQQARLVREEPRREHRVAEYSSPAGVPRLQRLQSLVRF